MNQDELIKRIVEKVYAEVVVELSKQAESAPPRIELDYVHAYYRSEKEKWVIRFNWHDGNAVAANKHITQTDDMEDARTLVYLFNKVAAITAEAGLPYIH